METKYFYYISKSKVGMLSSQIKGLSLSVSKSTSKIKTPVFEFGTEVEHKESENIVSETISLLKNMDKKGLIKPLGSCKLLNTKDFWWDENSWLNGIYSFGFGHEQICSYFLWRIHRNSIILLVGCPLDILGEKAVKGQAGIVGTVGILEDVIIFSDYLRNIIQPDENVLVIDKAAGDEYEKEFNEIVDKYDLPVTEYVFSSDAKGAVLVRPLFQGPPVFSRSVALGILCFGYLSRLPEVRIDTVFKLFHEFRMDVPEDLPKWAEVCKRIARPKEEDVDISEIERIRTVYVGSPIYTALA